MPSESPKFPPLFQLDVSADQPLDATPLSEEPQDESVGMQIVELLNQMLIAQERQNELLEELNEQTNAAQRQRAVELGQWKQANPELARGCRQAAETLSRVQTEFLAHLTREVADSGESLVDSDFMMNEFVDRYGPRLAHLNGVLQVLSQLSTIPNPTGTTS